MITTGRASTTAAAWTLMASILASMSCGDVARSGRSPAYLIVDLLTAASGASPGTFSTLLQSDVVTLVNTTVDGIQVRVPTVFEDVGQAALRIALKDQGNPGVISTPSTLNNLTVNRYRVVYKRADGRNTPGVDVPHPFDGAFTATITTTPVTVNFTLVRVQAKVEAPLRALVAGGAAIAISTIADVTFYGQDQAGNEFQAAGSISINFANWGDPE